MGRRMKNWAVVIPVTFEMYSHTKPTFEDAADHHAFAIEMEFSDLRHSTTGFEAKEVMNVFEKSHQICKEKGWHDAPTPDAALRAVKLLAMHTELFEVKRAKEPSAIAEEFADVALYAADYLLRFHGFPPDMLITMAKKAHEMDKRDAVRKTGKALDRAVRATAKSKDSVTHREIIRVLHYAMCGICGQAYYPLETISAKVNKNALRPHRHGGKVLG